MDFAIHMGNWISVDYGDLEYSRAEWRNHLPNAVLNHLLTLSDKGTTNRTLSSLISDPAWKEKIIFNAGTTARKVQEEVAVGSELVQSV